MEEIEIYSWATLDALKKVADIIETVGSLNESHQMSVFCLIEDDYLELCYTDSASSFLRHFQDEVEFAETIEERKIEIETGLYEADIYEDEEEILDNEDDSEKF
ncbi:MAG: hypothetical protein PHQ25_08340 [Acidobacteriota bacterium]|nr:hypothetical protein [Acidobacteriota bacterium]MDW3229626.1 hypothetical protein [Acidobacteriota bacterium]MDY0232154.1 hypothetical protein [Candidatus Saccharicenans sp.]